MKRTDIPVYTFYLDEDMVMNYVATSENGLSLLEKVQYTLGGTKSTELIGGGEVGAGFGPFAKTSVDGSMTRLNAQVDSELREYQVQRTMVSLFDNLRKDLVAAGKVVDLDSHPDHPLKPGDIVEAEGVFQANPFYDFEGLFDMYRTLSPFFASDGPSPDNLASGTRKAKSRSSQVAQVPDSAEMKIVQKMIELVNEGFKRSGVTDTRFSASSETYPNLILTLKSSEDINKTVAMASGASCSVFGKVTGILREGDTTRLYRHTP
jgi:hypothetical protein